MARAPFSFLAYEKCQLVRSGTRNKVPFFPCSQGKETLAPVGPADYAALRSNQSQSGSSQGKWGLFSVLAAVTGQFTGAGRHSSLVRSIE